MFDQTLLPPPPTPIAQNRAHSHRPVVLISFIIIIIILLGGGVFVAYTKQWGPFAKTVENKNANVTNSVVVTSPDVLLTQVKQAHFAVKYIGNNPLLAWVNDEGDLTVAGDYNYSSGMVKFPKEHTTNDPRDAGLETIGMFYMGSKNLRLGQREFQKINLDALLEANFITEESIKSPDMKNVGEWQEITFAEFHFVPEELYYLQNFSKLSKNFIKVDEHTWKGTMDVNVAKGAMWQIERWKGDHTHWRFFSEEQKKQEFADWAPTEIKKFPEFTVTLTSTGALEKVVFTDLYFPDTVTTFSKFDEPVVIQIPEFKDNPDVDAYHLNFVRADAIQFIGRGIIAAYAGKSFPITTSVVRLDDVTNPVVQTIMSDLATLTTTYSPYTTRAIEDIFWSEKLKDPISSKYYYGYRSDDGKSIHISFIQQIGGGPPGIKCNSEKANCVETISYPEDTKPL